MDVQKYDHHIEKEIFFDLTPDEIHNLATDHHIEKKIFFPSSDCIICHLYII